MVIMMMMMTMMRRKFVGVCCDGGSAGGGGAVGGSSVHWCTSWAGLLTLRKKRKEKKKDPGFRDQKLKKLLRMSYLERNTNDEQDDLPCGLRGTSSGNCQETKLSSFGHVTRHDSLSKTILQGTLEVWATPWSAEEMLDGQRKRVDVHAHVRTAHDGLSQKGVKEGLTT